MNFNNKVKCDNCKKVYTLNEISDFSDLHYGALYLGKGCPNCLKAPVKTKQMRFF